MQLSPIVLFVYNRLQHTRETVEALKKNHLANNSVLFIYSDGPKNRSSAAGVEEVRNYIKTISGFKSVSVIEREKNMGLANSIMDGVTKIVNKYGKIIVLEDDLITSPYFLDYMNDALNKYEYDERVISVHGWIYPVLRKLPETFFIRGADCWGWGTWNRGWKIFNSDGGYLLEEITRRKEERTFDINGSYPYTKMLKDQTMGLNDSWAVRWYASAFLAGKLTLFPGRSLVHNIGNDSSGTHCGNSKSLDVAVSDMPIKLDDIPVEHSREALLVIEDFLKRSKKSSLQRLVDKIFIRGFKK